MSAYGSYSFGACILHSVHTCTQIAEVVTDLCSCLEITINKFLFAHVTAYITGKVCHGFQPSWVENEV